MSHPHVYFSFCVILVLSHPHAKSFYATSVGKDWKSYELAQLAILSHSELFWWEKIGKNVN